MCDSACVLYLLTYLAELLCGEGAAAITVERLEPAQGETNRRHRLSRAADRLRATPSPWDTIPSPRDVRQGRPRTEGGGAAPEHLVRVRVRARVS